MPVQNLQNMAQASSSRFTGGGSPAGKKPYSKPQPVAAAVECLSESPDPVLTLSIPYPHESNRALCAVAKSCLHGNNWGCWQYNPDARIWNNVHKDSQPHEPRLNGPQAELLQATMDKFSASPHCSSITFRDNGQVVPMSSLLNIDWTSVADLAPPPPPVEEPQPSPGLQAVEARLSDIEARLALLEATPAPPDPVLL